MSKEELIEEILNLFDMKPYGLWIRKSSSCVAYNSNLGKAAIISGPIQTLKLKETNYE